MEESSVMMTGVNSERIIQAMNILSEQKRDDKRTLNIVQDYNVDNVSEKDIKDYNKLY